MKTTPSFVVDPSGLFEYFRKPCDTLNCGFWWTWYPTWVIRAKLKAALKSVNFLLLFSFPTLSFSVFSVYNSKCICFAFFPFSRRFLVLSKLSTKDLTRIIDEVLLTLNKFSKLIQLLSSGNKPILELTYIYKLYTKLAVAFFLIGIWKISLGCKFRFSSQWIFVML